MTGPAPTETATTHCDRSRSALTLSLTGVGPIGPAPANMQISLKVLKVRFRQKLGIPQAGSKACFKTTMEYTLSLISLLLIFL